MNYQNLILFTISIVVFIFVLKVLFSFIKNFLIIKNFTDYTTVLEYHMNKAYDLIYKDRILIYSIEATRLPDKDFNIISQDFIKLVLKLIGKNIKKQFIYLYGDEDTFIFNILEYFNTRYEGDEIRKSSLDNYSEDDINGNG